MKVDNKLMYHFHKYGIHERNWKIGSVIDNSTDGFLNYFSEMVDKCQEVYKFDDNFDIERLRRDYRACERISARLMLYELSVLIDEFRLYERERALEEVREKYYPDLVSRRRAIWVCDKEQLNFWKGVFTDKRVLYDVAVSGDMFVSSESLLPHDCHSYDEFLELAHGYWDPDLSKCPENSLEYLVNGQIKVLKKHR